MKVIQLCNIPSPLAFMKINFPDFKFSFQSRSNHISEEKQIKRWKANSIDCLSVGDYQTLFFARLSFVYRSGY